MHAYRSDRLVKVLARLVSIAYFGGLVGMTVLLIAGPVAKLFARDDPHWKLALQVPVTVLDSDATVRTRWGPGQLKLNDARANLALPIARLPWWLFAVLWTHTAIYFGLVLLALYHLRRIFQRVREGAPFDADNARRLRWVGLLLTALALFNGVAGFVAGMAIRSGLSSSRITVPSGLHINAQFLFVALVLVALTEVFRRGAELENEQSLVI